MQADLFVPGMPAAVAYVLIQARPGLDAARRRGVGIAALVVAAGAVVVVTDSGPVHGHLPDSVFALACGLALVAIAAAAAAGDGRPGSTRRDRGSSRSRSCSSHSSPAC